MVALDERLSNWECFRDAFKASSVYCGFLITTVALLKYPTKSSCHISDTSDFAIYSSDNFHTRVRERMQTDCIQGQIGEDIEKMFFASFVLILLLGTRKANNFKA